MCLIRKTSASFGRYQATEDKNNFVPFRNGSVQTAEGKRGEEGKRSQYHHRQCLTIYTRV